MVIHSSCDFAYASLVCSFTSGYGFSACLSATSGDAGASTSASRRSCTANVLANVATGIVTTPDELALSAFVFSMPRTVTRTVLLDGETRVMVSPTVRCLSLANSSRTTASPGPSFEMSVAAPVFHLKLSTLPAVAGSIPSTGTWSLSTSAMLWRTPEATVTPGTFDAAASEPADTLLQPSGATT